MSFIFRPSSSLAPLDYITPSFPSLYWPLPIHGPQTYYLYHPSDIWRFTLLWTLLFYAAVHLAVAGWACVIQWRNWKTVWVVPALFAVVGGIEGVIAGSVVGGLLTWCCRLSGVYNAGYFKMSTWIPFVWGLINALVLIISSFAINGGL
ncbi:hypothetical protein K432DRAFT_360214 [Lepidopterella palustris CBS 459.81]|uniref:Integral membrane protein n=1 Tax=Lepidopterella palustris CBS 459.81 TaxID=1314670 RepID=A0A8E2JC24_9PEZI|nr:hypothetical protein K432DRAFT_360214 [Lepidopterella palustris CBS 459.81]